MARYGYARVSSADQDYATQETRLKAAGCCESLTGGRACPRLRFLAKADHTLSELHR